MTAAENLSPLSDEALAARVADGNSSALEMLIHRYHGRIYALLLRATGRTSDAEDLCQETWIRLARRAQSFDPSAPLGPWLAGIAAHLAIDWARAKSVRARSAAPFAAAQEVPTEARSAQESLALQAERSRLAAALGAMPERLREVVLLRYFEELSEQEMATRLSVPRGTVKSRLHHALGQLKGVLREEPHAD